LNGTVFLVRCLQDFPCQIRYNYNEAARHVVPNVITVGSILEAIPLQDNDPIFKKVDPTNLSIVFEDDTYAKNTTSIAKLNPGYSTSSFTRTNENDYHPPIINDMDMGWWILCTLKNFSLFFVSRLYSRAESWPVQE